jgi:Lon protease-like protein
VVLPGTFERLPIFPLPDVQLFPHALLPLHVFEPRYRALTEDCLATDRRMAVATLVPGFEADYHGRPPVRAVCGVGEVLQDHRLPDGRYHILLRGLARVRILDELPPERAYRMVRAVLLDEIVRPDARLSAGLQALIALCDRLAAVLPSGSEMVRGLARQEAEPAAAADVIAAALVTDPEERRAVFEELDAVARLDRVAEVVGRLVGRMQGAGAGGAGSN